MVGAKLRQTPRDHQRPHRPQIPHTLTRLVNHTMTEQTLPDFARGQNGLLPAIAQDAATGEVLMLAWMNEEAWQETLRGGRATYYSRSRQSLWRKGDTSGHEQHVVEARVDCDGDAILLKV